MKKIALESGERIRTLRESQAISQGILAERVGISQNHVSQVERGVRGLSYEVLMKIALELNTSVAYLLGETDDPVRYSESLLGAAGKRPGEMNGNPPAPFSPDAKRRRAMLMEQKSSGDISRDIEETSVSCADQPPLSYWAGVVDNARAAVKRGDLKELQEIEMMLRKATVPVEDALVANKANAQLTLPDADGELAEQAG